MVQTKTFFFSGFPEIILNLQQRHFFAFTWFWGQIPMWPAITLLPKMRLATAERLGRPELRPHIRFNELNSIVKWWINGRKSLLKLSLSIYLKSKEKQ